jgi:hypothetical protein
MSKTKIETLDMGSVGTFIVSKRLKAKIDHLHRVVGAKEWSGILLYKTKSRSIRNLKDLIFVGIDVYPMDIGSTGATSFNYDSSIVDMYTDIPDAMTLQTGLIHTHHSMKAFISGTDFDEIVTNASHYNYYVSLVVSFDQDYVCKVAFPTEVKNTIKFEIKDSNGKSIPVKTEVVDHNLILSTLNVVFEQESTLDDWFIKKIADIKSAAVSATKKSSYPPTSGQEKVYSLPPVSNTPAVPIHKNYSNNDDYYKSKYYDSGGDWNEKYPSMSERFTIAILSLQAYTTAEISKKNLSIKSCVNDIITSKAEDFSGYMQLLAENMDILHDNVFGVGQMRYYKHDLKSVIQLLILHNSSPRIKKIIGLIENELNSVESV